jgi:hypothetical protein
MIVMPELWEHAVVVSWPLLLTDYPRKSMRSLWRSARRRVRKGVGAGNFPLGRFRAGYEGTWEIAELDLDKEQAAAYAGLAHGDRCGCASVWNR